MDVCCKLRAPSLTNNKADVACSNLIGFTNTVFPTIYLNLSNVVNKELTVKLISTSYKKCMLRPFNITV